MTKAIAIKADLFSNEGKIIYTVPEGMTFTGNIRLTNRNSTATKVTVAFCDGNNPSDTDYIEYEAVVCGNTPLEDTGMIIVEKENVYVKSSADGVSVRLYGVLDSL